MVKALTLSPERGLFFGLLGTVSSLGLVSMAQYEPWRVTPTEQRVKPCI